MESATQTLYVGSKSEDKTLGLLALWIDASGELTNHYATEIALTGEVDESETIRQLLTDFYLSTAEENKTHGVPLFADQQLEKQNGEYISANTCQELPRARISPMVSNAPRIRLPNACKKGALF